MSLAPHFVLTTGDWFSLFMHYLTLSLLSVGGAISTTPDMHRFLVDRQGWLSDSQFNASITLAQSAPGPNVLFVALLGWHVGMNAGGVFSGLLGVLLTMLGILLPSTVLTYSAAQWAHRQRERRAVRAFKQGMAPLVIAMLLASSWVLSRSNKPGSIWQDWPLYLLTLSTALIVWRTRLHVLWLLAAGAVLGGLGLV